ncbi:tRNA (adenosine(37)-N6)-dimethylallyltransferase MiaA [bacterium]|nr:tRNA (adenosine(37)-N6)-dimethylallyltransferase MiaA [bacterium]
MITALSQDLCTHSSASMPLMQRPIVIIGPTASGKSTLAVQLAKKIDGEVISADSRQVYKGLNVGTGKITKKEMSGVPHHLLDVASPKKVFTAYDFVQHGRKAMADIQKRGKVSIIAGGTGFYIDALLGRVSLPKVERDTALREQLSHKSTEQLFSLLQKRDPERAQNMNTPSERNNKVRLIRALEIAGSKSRTQTPLMPEISAQWFGISIPQAQLDTKIAQRLKVRIPGIVREVGVLHKKGVSWKRMEELGLEYRYVARMLQKKITRSQFEQELFREIHDYSKRQMTYWKRNKKIHWGLPTITAVMSYLRSR